MTVNDRGMESIGGKGYEQDEELLEKVRAVLGAEAVERFFGATEKMSSEERFHAVFSLRNLVDFMEPHVDTSQTQEVDLHSVEEAKPLSQLMSKPLQDIFGQLPDTLTADDSDAMVAALLELRGEIAGRVHNIDAGRRLRALVNGMSLSQVVELEGSTVKRSTVSTWTLKFRDTIMKQKWYSPEYAHIVLQKKLDEAKDLDEVDEQPIDESTVIEPVPAEVVSEVIPFPVEIAQQQPVAEPAPIEITREVESSPIEIYDEQAEKLFNGVIERFEARGYSDEKLRGLKKILSFYDGERRMYDEVAFAGREVIAGLLHEHSELISDEDKKRADGPYNYLRYLSGYGLHNQDRPRRMEMIAMKFKMSKEEVRRDSLALIDDLMNFEPVVEPQPIAVQVVQHEAIQTVDQPEVALEPEAEPGPKQFDMFKVAIGKQEIPAEDWNESVATFFDRAVDKKKLTQAQAGYIKDRINQRGASKELSVEMLQAIRSLIPRLGPTMSPRLAMNPNILSTVEMFVKRRKRLEDMVEERQRTDTRKSSVIHQTIQRELYGGLSELLWMNEQL